MERIRKCFLIHHKGHKEHKGLSPRRQNPCESAKSVAKSCPKDKQTKPKRNFKTLSYTGSTADLSKRLRHHEIGAISNSYTYSRRPVKLVWTSEEVYRYSDALRFERQIKGWSRAKKQALIQGDYDAVHEVVTRQRKQREKNKRQSSR